MTSEMEKYHSPDDDSLIPYCLYYDEVEVGNPQGFLKFCHKIGVVYISLRCFPTHVYSTLKYIHDCVLVPTEYRCILDKVVAMLIPHLTGLKNEGIFIHGKLCRFHFVGFIGGNLG